MLDNIVTLTVCRSHSFGFLLSLVQNDVPLCVELLFVCSNLGSNFESQPIASFANELRSYLTGSILGLHFPTESIVETKCIQCLFQLYKHLPNCFGWQKRRSGSGIHKHKQLYTSKHSGMRATRCNNRMVSFCTHTMKRNRRNSSIADIGLHLVAFCFFNFQCRSCDCCLRESHTRTIPTYFSLKWVISNEER